jgi:uncharacterized protein (DUF608 family)
MSDCDCHKPGCGGGPSRREFLAMVGIAGAAALTGEATAAAPGPAPEPPPLEKLVPADKKLKADWVKSLFERGTPAVWRGDDLKYIGMPVGGLCAGQVYLGGDGRLWLWDIFNANIRTRLAHYAQPMEPASPLDQGFAIRTRAGGKAQVRALDRTGFKDISFRGEYPIGYVEYRDPASPVEVRLEAFSPFIPLNVDDSSLPAIVMQFTVKNTGAAKVEAEVAGWLENAVCLDSGRPGAGVHHNSLVPPGRWYFLECRAEKPSEGSRAEKPPEGTRADKPPESTRAEKRPDVLFEDFEKQTYEGWTATGTAFGTGPVAKSKVPAYQGDVGAMGERLVNSHASAPGGSVREKDSATGTLTSKPFTIERDYITFLIGGGTHKERTCINLLVDERVVLSATGKDDNRMQPCGLDVRPWGGKTARLQIVDNEKAGWGNIGIDQIVFTDVAAVAAASVAPAGPAGPLAEQPDFGTMGLAILGPPDGLQGAASVPEGKRPESIFADAGLASDPSASKPFGQKLCGAAARTLALAPGQSAAATFVLAWRFPNLRMDKLPGGRHYAARFKSAAEVAAYVKANFERLAAETRLWHDTWYDSTLPRWFLDRTFLNTSILATSTCLRFADGRFYGWEGVGCCAGTCMHVWHYAHAPARLFPELERILRERVDYGVAMNPETGMIRFRAENNNMWAADGQAGCILRTLREHQMSADDAFLRRVWPRAKKALEFLIGEDGNADGILEGSQHNTLDANWYGPVAWLSGLYLAALRAGEEMARDLGDDAFARRCRTIFEAGAKNFVDRLWGTEYFINLPDPKHPEAINSGTGCEIDQVMGQSWAFQVGLGRVLPEDKTRTALGSLWRYNFAPDVGPYREAHKPGRWFAMPGEAGLLMCTFPRKDWNFQKALGRNNKLGGPSGYFNECMNGFEYQAAGHMIWEGLVQEGLAVARAVHDRYHPSKRNPWNEVECGDHYARSMASYGVYLAACGYEHHGPKGHVGFAPRLASDDFRAAFTAAEGWGTFSQKRDAGGLRAAVALRWGRLRLRTVAFQLPEGAKAAAVDVTAAGAPVQATLRSDNGRATIALGAEAVLAAGQSLEITIH